MTRTGNHQFCMLPCLLLIAASMMGCGNGTSIAAPVGITGEWEGPTTSQQGRSLDSFLYVRFSQNGTRLTGFAVTGINGIRVTGTLTGENDAAADPLSAVRFNVTFNNRRVNYEGQEVVHDNARFIRLRYRRFATDGVTLEDEGTTSLTPYVPPPDDGGE